jgi:DNA polymerase elongation subunit (family B)
MQDFSDPLIYGKNPTQKLVGIEVQDDKAVLFTEDGENISQKVAPNRYWVLLNRSQKQTFRLQGNLHYQYGKQFFSQEEWNIYLQSARKTKTDFFTVYDPKEALMIKDGYTFYKGMQHTDPSILSFDIEATGLYHDNTSKVLLISNTFRKNGNITRKLFAYDDYSSQGEMLTAWCNWVRELNPSIICGHNIYSYDFPYLNYIAEQEGIELNLGRDGSALKINNKPSKFRVDGSRDLEYNKIRIYGREVIDTYFLAIKHDAAAKKYDSYGLKNIIKIEGLEKKNREFYDASVIRFKYTDPVEWDKIKRYCIDDSDDALAVFDLTSPASFYLTQSVPKTFQQVVESATGSQINAMMIRSYLQHGHSIPKASEVKSFEGAISFGNPGIYRNVHKVDIASLYPSIILACKVYDEDKDPKGNFLKIIEKFTEERLKNKKLAKESVYYDGLQNAQKIVINSGYGFMGATGLNFNSPDAAEFITSTGREILKSALEWAERMGFNVPNADTDSISYCKRDGEFITESEREENLKAINALYPERIRWEDDGYYPTVAILKAKNYVLFDGKKTKIKGSALKASTKPPALKEMIKEVIDSILNHKQNYVEIYNKYIKEACDVQDIKRWSSRKTISEKTLNSERTNEARIRDTLDGSEYVEGDRIWVYYKDKNTLELAEKFNGQYDVDRLLGMVYDTIYVFETVLDCDALFKNYKLKKNKEALKELLNETSYCREERSSLKERENCSSSSACIS